MFIFFFLAETLSPSWLALLVDPRFHCALRGLFARAVFLLHLLKTSACTQHHCDPLTMQMRLQTLCTLLTQNGVHFTPALTATVSAEEARL